MKVKQKDGHASVGNVSIRDNLISNASDISAEDQVANHKRDASSRGEGQKPDETTSNVILHEDQSMESGSST